MEIDDSGYTPAAKRLLAEYRELSVIPPKNGQSYRNDRYRYITGENTSVTLGELQANLAKVLADEPDLPLAKAYVKAGYAYESYFNEGKNVKRIEAHLTGMCKSKMSPQLTALMHYIKYGAAEELKIDATYILNEQVSLYEECRRAKQYTQAIRLLNDLSYHVDVDSRVNNRVEIVDNIDYAALLQQADKRTKSLPATEDTDVVEGEYEVVDTPVVSH